MPSIAPSQAGPAPIAARNAGRTAVAVSWLQSLNRLVKPTPRTVRFSHDLFLGESKIFLQFAAEWSNWLEFSTLCQFRKAESKVRVAIVSDIHGNRRALDAVLADLRQVAPDLVFQGGDLAAGGPRPADIIDQVRSLGWPGVSGNTDEMLWAPERLTAFAATQPQLAFILAKSAEAIPSL